MRTLKKLTAAVVLMCVLGLTAFADTPSCTPGEILTPPCVMAQAPTPGDTVPGQIDTLPAAQSDASFTEIAASVLFGIMSLF